MDVWTHSRACDVQQQQQSHALGVTQLFSHARARTQPCVHMRAERMRALHPHTLCCHSYLS